MKLKYCLFLITLLAFAACTDTKPVETDNEANETDSIETDVNNSEEISNIIPEVEEGQQDRLIWQQPGKILSLFGDLTGKTVADVGAGSGFFTVQLAYRNAKVLALDIDKKSIDFINNLKVALNEKGSIGENIETRLVAPDNTYLKNEEVDYILIVNTLPYISNRIPYLRHLTKALKKGGKIVIVDFKMKKIPDEVGPPLSERLPLYKVEQDLEKAGFTLLKSDDASLDFQYVVQAIVE